jgi:hypothetical protein
MGFQLPPFLIVAALLLVHNFNLWPFNYVKQISNTNLPTNIAFC